MMSKVYEDEQSELKVKISELSSIIEEKEQKSADTEYSKLLFIIGSILQFLRLLPTAGSMAKRERLLDCSLSKKF